MRIVAIMPIKLNNERLPGKNIMQLGTKPLLCYELENLLETGFIDKTYVYCSNNEIEKYIPEGIEYLQRSTSLDLPSANFSQIFKCFADAIDADIYVYAHATAPFITIDTMRACINAVKSGNFDSAFCASKIQDFLWKDGNPINFDAENVPRSQDIEPIYRETSGIYVFKKEVFSVYHRRIGKHPFIQEVSYKEAVDINNPEDFEIAKALLNVDI